MLKVFEHTKWYDEEISSYLRKCFDSEGRRIITLKYGINPQQTDAQVYFEGSDMPLKGCSISEFLYNCSHL